MHELLKNFVERLHEAAKTNLESVIVYGAGAQLGASATPTGLHLLCTLHSLSVAELGRVAPVVRWWTESHQQPPPLFFTSEELSRSADVFSIELLDIQGSHRVLYGSDVIANISVPMNLHRIQVEYEFRTTLLKLRQHFLLHPEDSAELQQVLRKSFPTVLTLLRHTLMVFERPVPSDPREICAQVAVVTGADAKFLQTGLQWRETEQPEGALLPAYGAYLAALEKVISALDHQVPKHQWQRAGS